MAKLQVLIAMTLNGFVPARNDSLLQWIQNSDDGFPYWRGRSTRMLYPGYPLVDLICDKEQSAPSDIYLAEIYDDSGAELLRGLSLYRLIDEMVIFLLPVISSETVPVSKHISTDKWELVRTKRYFIIYSRKCSFSKKSQPGRASETGDKRKITGTGFQDPVSAGRHRMLSLHYKLSPGHHR